MRVRGKLRFIFERKLWGSLRIYISNKEFDEDKNKIDFDVKKIDHCFKNAFK